jgi:hypothetical protein
MTAKREAPPKFPTAAQAPAHEAMSFCSITRATRHIDRCLSPIFRWSGMGREGPQTANDCFDRHDDSNYKARAEFHLSGRLLQL